MKKNNLITNKYIIGVLFSGRMSKDSIINPLIKIKRMMKDNEYVEVVFHPGIAKQSEQKYWDNSPSLAKFYTSRKRAEENTVLSENYHEFY